MNVKLKNIKIVVIILVFGNIFLNGQNKNDLIREREKALKEIELTNKLLSEVKKTKDYNLNDLNLIQKKIKNRNEIIKNINKEINEIDKNILKNTGLLKSLENDLVKTKNEYSKLVYLAYRDRGNYLNIMYLLASEDLDKAYRRFKYIKQYTDYRRKQVRLINALNDIINKKIVTLENDKNLKYDLLNDRKNEMNKLNIEKISKDEVISELKKRENKLNKEIQKNREIAGKIEKEIEILINEERKKGATYMTLTPKEKLLANEFQENKGKLPWPAEYGVVIDKYGEHDHPVLKGIKIRNNGIDISTIKDSEIRSVFKGVISKVLSIKGANYTVIIKHGNFFTVYHNLNNVIVKSGDLVQTKQKIGYVFSEIEKSNANLHFEIWKEMEKQNPEIWLSN